ncbi:MAG: hypothetical protein JO347_11305 [Candidatus Eremiobacteraeota bacterium]|nr:hypothetical protein [Candidatus Eremiobacteraeota bacterium]
MSQPIKTLAQARARIAALEAELKRKPAAEVNLLVESAKPNALVGAEAKPTVDSILGRLEAKLITFAEAQAALQAIAKAAKPAEMNKAFKAIARVQKAEALERLANLPRGKRLI